MRGQLAIHAYDIRTGKRMLLTRTNNLVLNAMYEKFVHLLGGTQAQSYIDRMQFGTGTTTPSATQTFLQRPVTPIKSVTPSIVLPYSVTFSAYLMADEANGFPLAEAGLMAVDDTLLARATYTVQTKTSSYIWGFTWTVTVKSGEAPPTVYTVPVEEGELLSLLFGGMIVGESEVGVTYGDLLLTQETTITGMQASVLGQPPTGAGLIIHVVKDGVDDTGRSVTVADGGTSAVGSFSTPLVVPAGTRLQFKPSQVGSTTPGDWVLIYWQTEVSPSA